MTDFSELGLSPETLKAVADSGYTTATPIQAQAIPVAMAGGDVLGIAQTGTGKTAAFTLPMIEKLASGRTKARMPRALVMEPTRELADQVAVAFERYAKGTKLTWALLIGGVSFGDQEKKLDRGVDVLIATPGRLLDHFERGKLLMTGVQMLVVDEADRMLDMGFIPDIERIFKLTPPKKQTLFFSATMPPEITRLTKQFLKDPTRIEVAKPATTAENIAQFLVPIPISDPAAKRTGPARTGQPRGRQERHRLLQPQERGRRGRQVAAQPRLRRRRHPWRPGPIHPHPHPGQLPQGRAAPAGRVRCGRAPDWTFPTSATSSTTTFPTTPTTMSTASRPHRPRRQDRRGLHDCHAGRFALARQGGEADRQGRPEELKIDADWDEARAKGERQKRAAGERDRERGGGRGRSGGRERSGRSSERPRREDRPARTEADEAPVAIAAPVEAAPQPEPATRTREPRRDRERSPRPQPAAEARAEPKPARDNDDDDRSGVRGFGSDTPAFLMRTPPKTS